MSLYAQFAHVYRYPEKMQIGIELQNWTVNAKLNDSNEFRIGLHIFSMGVCS